MFETVDFDDCVRADRIAAKVVSQFANSIDFVLIPELNRIDYFVKSIPNLGEKTFHLPNTTVCAPRTGHTKQTSKQPVQLLHVGSLGDQTTYWRSAIDVIENLKGDAHMTMIGQVSSVIQDEIASRGIPWISVVDSVPHDELVTYYLNCDVGLVLYRPISLNAKLAAPNKLYEFWSHGIPVLGPRLPGLMSQFDHPELGALIDMESQIDFSNAIVASAQTAFTNRAKIKATFESCLCAEIVVVPQIRQILAVAAAIR